MNFRGSGDVKPKPSQPTPSSPRRRKHHSRGRSKLTHEFLLFDVDTHDPWYGYEFSRITGGVIRYSTRYRWKGSTSEILHFVDGSSVSTVRRVDPDLGSREKKYGKGVVRLRRVVECENTVPSGSSPPEEPRDLVHSCGPPH